MQCKSSGKNHGNKKVYIIHTIAKNKSTNLRWKYKKNECVFKNTTHAP